MPPAGSTPTTRASATPRCGRSTAGADLFLIHVEATDEAGHAGNLEEKMKALEAWDRRILAGLVDGLDALGPWRMLLLPDHPTPVELKTHTTDSVPYLLVDSAVDGPGGTYTEAGHRRLRRRARPRAHGPPRRTLRREGDRRRQGGAAQAQDVAVVRLERRLRGRVDQRRVACRRRGSPRRAARGRWRARSTSA